MDNNSKTNILNALLWAFVIVAVAVILKGTPYKTRVVAVLSLGFSISLGILAAQIKK
ncbi:MAG: hypothetical protein ABIK65_01770 [Candidatus Eisenbacteria bacterium]